MLLSVSNKVDEYDVTDWWPSFISGIRQCYLYNSSAISVGWIVWQIYT